MIKGFNRRTIMKAVAGGLVAGFGLTKPLLAKATDVMHMDEQLVNIAAIEFTL